MLAIQSSTAIEIFLQVVQTTQHQCIADRVDGVQSGDNRRCVLGGEWSTDCLRTSRSGNVSPGAGTPRFGQTSRDSTHAVPEASAAHWTSLWFSTVLLQR